MLTHPIPDASSHLRPQPSFRPAAIGDEPAAEHALAFSKAQFEQVCKLIYRRAGIHLQAGKHNMVYNRLARRVRACGMDSFSDYLALLDNPKSHEWEQFTNALTTNLTSFFREAHHFPLLAAHLQKLDESRPIHIWCTAASTGEEPYTIAITACEALGRAAANVHITASDIDTTVLDTAAAGAYEERAVEKMDAALVRKYFLRGTGAMAGMVKVRPALRDMISFCQVNLLNPVWPRFGPFDVVFCRNVMIYFDKPTQARLVERFATLMRPGSLLFAGHSEHLPPGAGQFALRGKTVYTRTAK